MLFIHMLSKLYIKQGCQTLKRIGALKNLQLICIYKSNIFNINYKHLIFVKLLRGKGIVYSSASEMGFREAFRNLKKKFERKKKHKS